MISHVLHCTRIRCARLSDWLRRRTVPRIILQYFLYVFALIVCTTPALAKVQAAPGQWVDDRFLVYDTRDVKGLFIGRCFIDENDHILESIPSVAEAVDFPIHSKYRYVSLSSNWHSGALYAVARGENERTKEGVEFRRHTFAKWEDGKWHFLGDYKNTRDIKASVDAIPCDDDRFIVISNTDLTGNNGPDRSLFHRMSIHPNKDKKEIRLDASIAFRAGLDELQQHLHNPTVSYLPTASLVAMTDQYAVLVNRKTGLFWIFSLEKATLTNSGMVFKKMTLDMVLKGGFAEAILWVNPEKDGTVLISAQEEAAFMTETGDAIKELNEMLQNRSINKLTDKEIDEQLETRTTELARRNPFMVWYRLYPENGKVEKLGGAPMGGVDIRDGNKTNFWRPLPDGSVRMGMQEFKTPPEAKPKSDPDENREGEPQSEEIGEGESDTEDIDAGQ